MTKKYTSRTIMAADAEAKRRWGPLGVAFVGDVCKVGRFTRSPAHLPPPHPIDIYGEGETFEAAFADVDTGRPLCR